MPIDAAPDLRAIQDQLSPVRDERQRQKLRERRERALELNPRLELLENALLELAGEFVVFPGNEPDLERILERGQLFSRAVEHRPGAPSSCHANAARLWRKNPRDLGIVVGYGLSDDSLWRSHTWLIQNATLIETTEPRLLYFGTLLTHAEAESFAAFQL